MGSRASYATVRDGRTRFHYDKWGADIIARTLAVGPEYTLWYIDQDPREFENLRDEHSCLAGVLMDLDARRLLFFLGGCAYTPGLLRHYLRLLRHYWPGWDVRWADRGIIDIAVAVGVDPDSVRREERESDYVPRPLATEPPEFVGTLITVVRSGTVADYGFEEYLTEVLAHGPGLVDALQGRDNVPLIEHDDLEGGALLDADRREAWVWWRSKHDERRLNRIARLWPGWAVHYHAEGLRRQVELSGRDASRIEPDEDEAVRRFVDLFAEGGPFEPLPTLKWSLWQDRGADAPLAPGLLPADRPDLSAMENEGILGHVRAAFRARPGGGAA